MSHTDCDLPEVSILVKELVWNEMVHTTFYNPDGSSDTVYRKPSTNKSNVPLPNDVVVYHQSPKCETHDYITDYIDISPDRSMIIRYCGLCGYTEPE